MRTASPGQCFARFRHAMHASSRITMWGEGTVCTVTHSRPHERAIFDRKAKEAMLGLHRS